MQLFRYMGDERHKRKYLEGPKRLVTPALINRMRERMHQRGWDDAQLARAVGCDKSLIKKLETQQSSKAIDAIGVALGVDLTTPTVRTVDPEVAAAARHLEEMDDEKRKHFIALILAS